VASGVSCNAAALERGCAPSTAVCNIARFRAEGEAALLDGRVVNDLGKIDIDVRGGACEIPPGTPGDHGFTRSTWTMAILRAVVETVLRVALALGSLWMLLHRLGICWGQPRPIVACPW
jgi:transposase